MIFKYNLGVPISAENICQKAYFIHSSTITTPPCSAGYSAWLFHRSPSFPQMSLEFSHGLGGWCGLIRTEKSQKKTSNTEIQEQVMIDIELQLSSYFLKQNTYKESPNGIFGGSDPWKNPPLDIPEGCHDQFIIQKEVSKMCHLCFLGLLMFLCCMQVLTAFRIHFSFYPWAIHQFFLRSKLLPPAAETVVANPPAAPLASLPPSPCRPGRSMAQLFPSKKMQLKRVGNGSSKMQFQTDERLFLSKKTSSLFFCTRGGVRVTILNSTLARRKHKFSAQPTRR